MRNYESIFITDATLSEEELDGVLNKVQQIIERYEGTLHQHSIWGKRRLAYPVKKQTHGVYHLLYLSADVRLLEELHQQYHYIDGILKYQTIKVENWEVEAEKFGQLAQTPHSFEDSELDIAKSELDIAKEEDTDVLEDTVPVTQESGSQESPIDQPEE